MFIEPEPWEEQFFKDVPTGKNIIPVDDCTAYIKYWRDNWVYNKICLMNSQQVKAFPHGIEPVLFPVFSKPIFNLYGMSIGAKKMDSFDMDKDYQAGHFWMEFLEGEHHSVDVIVDRGSCKHLIATQGIKNEHGCFDYWIIKEECPKELEDMLREWTVINLPMFRGIANFEIIGTTIIECHLRLTPQWIDMYGSEWLDSVVQFFIGRKWEYNGAHEEGYSFVLRTKTPGHYKVDPSYKEKLEGLVDSIQITFRDDVHISCEANDMYSYRLAVVNGHDSGRCHQARELLKELITKID